MTRSRKKILQIFLYACYLFIVVAVMTELLSPVVFRSMTGQKWDKAAMQENIKKSAQETQPQSSSPKEKGKKYDYLGQNILHPYVGYVRDSESGSRFNEYGFQGIDPILKRKKGQINIAICGGSVAVQIWGARKLLKEELSKHPGFKGKKIQVATLALGGYKQPQQLMNLSQFLFLGAEYDIVINLDGFNDLALPYAENRMDTVNPYFPRSWNLIAGDITDFSQQQILGHLYQAKKEQSRLAREYVQSPWVHSNFFLIVWKLRHEKQEQVFQQAYEDFNLATNQLSKGRQVRGPDYDFEDKEKFFKDLSQKWGQASVMMQALCEREGIQYHHFLQPNQYIPGTKPMDKNERRTADIRFKAPNGDTRSHRMADAIELGYHEFQKEGKRLASREGLRFSDLSFLFEQEKRPVYKDHCCHFNELGTVLLTQRIAQQILQHNP